MIFGERAGYCLSETGIRRAASRLRTCRGSKGRRGAGAISIGPEAGFACNVFPLFRAHTLGAGFPAHAPQRHGGGVLAVIRHLVLDLAGRDPADHSGALIGVGGAFLAFWSTGHCHGLMLSGKLGKLSGEGNIMKIRLTMLALCAGTFAICHADMALAAANPIPGVDVIVKKHPIGMIKVGDCQSGGGKVVKKGGQWTCVGMPAQKSSSKTGSRSNIKHPEPPPK